MIKDLEKLIGTKNCRAWHNVVIAQSLHVEKRELTPGEKGTITFIVSILFKYIETLPRDLLELESKKKKNRNT